jgi:dTDP-4-dehydrorhamnose reductase
MVKIAILGSTGMLGNAVSDYFLGKENYQVYLSSRDEACEKENHFYFDATNPSSSVLPQVDYVINCIGVIKPFMKKGIENAIVVNSIFPHKFANFCKENNTKLIHITTDCVFSGKTGRYFESSLHDCLDEYGKTKSLGEPNNCMVIRTSIIGQEIKNNVSLVEWARSQKGKEVRGFTNHLWNGVTTTEYAKICDQIIQKNLYKEELYHVYSNYVNKFQLLNFKFDF